MPLDITRNELVRSHNFIAGRWCAAADAAVFACTEPRRRARITQVPDSGAADAKAAVEAAHAAFPGWRATPAKERAQLLKRWNDLIVEHQEDLGRLISREQGKPLAEGRGEVLYAASYVEWFAEEATRNYGDVIPAPVRGRRMVALKEPVGSRRGDHAMELSCRDDRAQDRACAWRPVARWWRSQPKTRRSPRSALIHLAEEAGVPCRRRQHRHRVA